MCAKRLCPICKKNEVSGRNRVCNSVTCREEMKKSWYYTSLVAPDGYLEAKKYAELKGISRQMVTRNCRAGKYPNAFQDPRSGRWYIPKDGVEITNFVEAAKRRKTRPFKATDAEWKRIVEAAALTKYSVNEFLIRRALGKDV